jgi:hypothetical protein
MRSGGWSSPAAPNPGGPHDWASDEDRRDRDGPGAAQDPDTGLPQAGNRDGWIRIVATAGPASIIEALGRAHRRKRQLKAGKFISVTDLPHGIEDVTSDALVLTAATEALCRLALAAAVPLAVSGRLSGRLLIHTIYVLSRGKQSLHATCCQPFLAILRA